MLWGDVWNGHHPMSEFPRLYSFARNNKIPVAQFISNVEVHLNFNTTISQAAAQELLQLNQIISQVPHNQLERDIYMGKCSLCIQQVLFQ
jgi:hypothetical protein